MEWIEFSVDNRITIPAPRGKVWPFLVDPALWSATRRGIVLAITASGTPGTEGHTIYFEHDSPNCGQAVHKTKVLKSEPPAIWATLTEQAGWSCREYYALTPTHDDRWTEVHLHGMYREATTELDAAKRSQVREARASQVMSAESEAADFFASAIVSYLEGHTG